MAVTETRGDQGLISLSLTSSEIQPKGRIKRTIFDWYGTLYDCMDQFPKIFAEEAHRRFGIDEGFAYRNFLRNTGFSLDVQIEDLIGSERYSTYDTAVIEAAKVGISNRLDDLDAPCYEDVPGALYVLKNRGYELSILSYNKEKSIKDQLMKNGIPVETFDVIAGRDSSPLCAEKGEGGFKFIAGIYQKSDDKLTYGRFINTSVFVTDMAVDAERSLAGGMPVIARRGFTSPDQRANPLFHAKAEWVINNFSALPQILEIM